MVTTTFLYYYTNIIKCIPWYIKEQLGLNIVYYGPFSEPVNNTLFILKVPILYLSPDILGHVPPKGIQKSHFETSLKTTACTRKIKGEAANLP